VWPERPRFAVFSKASAQVTLQSGCCTSSALAEYDEFVAFALVDVPSLTCVVHTILTLVQ